MAYKSDWEEYETFAREQYLRPYQEYGARAAEEVRRSYEPQVAQAKAALQSVGPEYAARQGQNDWNLLVAARKLEQQMANIGNESGGLAQAGKAALAEQHRNVQRTIGAQEQAEKAAARLELEEIEAERDTKAAQAQRKLEQQGQKEYADYLADVEKERISAQAKIAQAEADAAVKIAQAEAKKAEAEAKKRRQ